MMTPVQLPRCDFDDPVSVVLSFVTAMNDWELAAWQAQRECRNSDDPAAYQAPVLREMSRVFMTYCTQKNRKQGRQGSFQRPPEYDSATESITGTPVDQGRKRAYVTTERKAVFDGGAYCYVLHRKGNQWLIDSLKSDVDGEWRPHIL